MKANELRIGNLVKWYDVSKVLELHSEKNKFDNVYIECEESFEWTEYDKLEPIPLTEECVFELQDKYWEFVGYGTRLIYKDILRPAIKIEKLKTQWAFYFNDELIIFKDYMHEAQNLYFALTGAELTVA